MTKKEDKETNDTATKVESNAPIKPDFSLEIAEGLNSANILFKNTAVATLEKGESALKPLIKLKDKALPKDEKPDDFLAKAQNWLNEHIESNLKSLILMDKEINQNENDKEEALNEHTKEIAKKLLDNLGIMDRAIVEDRLKKLSTEERKGLWQFKVKIGASTIFIPFILKPAPTQLRLLLWALNTGKTSLPSPPVAGMVWVDMNKNISPDFYRLCGYRPAGKKAVRVDMVERLADAVRPQGLKGASFQVTPETMGLVGLSGDDFASVMNMIGYQSRKHAPKKPTEDKPEENKEENSKEANNEFYSFTWVGPKKPQPKKEKLKAKPRKATKTKSNKKSKSEKEFVMDPNSPFAALSVLKNTMKKSKK